MTRAATTLLLVPLLACGPEPGVEAGRETGPCSQGECFPGLACLSDLCVDPDWEPPADEGSSGEPDDSESESESEGETGPVGNPSAVDVLFVVDNSGSMGNPQQALSMAAAQFVGALEGLGVEYRIGVTTTDVGNYWCRGAGISDAENGALVSTSCRRRIDDFYFTGDNVDASEVCNDFCPAQQGDFRLEPGWIDSAAGNLPSGLDLTTTMQCLLPQGVNGCGFEAPLRALYQTAARSADASDSAFGFIREDAHLMVVILSDEADCSAQSEAIFHEDGNRVFWSLPDEQQSPTSAVCWNAGVACTPEGAGTYDDCVPQDKDVSGNPTDDPSAAVLFSLSHYQALLDDLTASKAGTGGKVFIFGILGVPEAYPEEAIVYARGANANNPDSFQAKFGTAEGCTSQVAQAVPPARLRHHIEDNSPAEAIRLYSVCANSYGPALVDMVNQVGAFLD